MTDDEDSGNDGGNACEDDYDDEQGFQYVICIDIVVLLVIA